mgnify:CR=1 FL=1
MTGTLIYKMLLVTHFATSPQCEDWTERMYAEKANCFGFQKLKAMSGLVYRNLWGYKTLHEELYL